MLKFLKVQIFILTTLLLCAVISHAQEITPPPGFDEGTETKLTPEQVAEILPWTLNSQNLLKDLLSRVENLPYSQARVELIRGIQEASTKSFPKRSELLMRFALNRALKIASEIEKEASLATPGVVDQEVRILKFSAELAINYYPNDIEYLNGKPTQGTDPVSLPYAQFGVQYAQTLMSVTESILDASAQYKIGIIALGLLQWDLYRDMNKVHYATAIQKIYTFLKNAPQAAAPQDALTVKQYMPQLRKVYAEAVNELAGQNLKVPGALPTSSTDGIHVGSRVVGIEGGLNGRVGKVHDITDIHSSFQKVEVLLDEDEGGSAQLVTFPSDRLAAAAGSGCYSTNGGQQICNGDIVNDYDGDKCEVKEAFVNGYIRCYYKNYRKLNLNRSTYTLKVNEKGQIQKLR